MSPLLAEAGCLRLHQALLADTVERTSGLPVAHYLFLADCTEEELRQAEQSGCFPSQWKLLIQQGRDLGQRLLNADQWLRQTYSRVAFLGSDSPTLPLDWIEQAFQRLTVRPAVIGPTTDGGYYLLGLAGARPQLFKGIDWGTQRVLQQTRNRLQPEELELLPVWYDVDEPSDLNRLRDDLESWQQGQAGFPARTARVLEELTRN